MAFSLSNVDLKKWKSYADWKLLALLLLFLNVKLAIKIPAIVLIYLFQFDFKFGFRFKNSRLPFFYILIIVLAFAGLIFSHGYSSLNYLIAFITGLFFWLCCILAIHQVKLSVEKNDVEVLHLTITLFFVINAAMSAINLLAIIAETHAFNPYLYQGNYQKYFIGTGDYIKGITFDTSTTNAAINAMGVIYFLVRQKPVMLMACMATLLLTGSNYINIVLMLVLTCLFIFRSTRTQKSMVVVCLMFLVVFMVKISPQNNMYVSETVKNLLRDQKHYKVVPKVAEVAITERPDSELNTEERKEKKAKLYLDSLSSIEFLKDTKDKSFATTKPVIRNDDGRILVPQANIHSASYQSIKVPLSAQQPLIQFILHHEGALPISAKEITPPALPGKAISIIQTTKFLAQHPAKILVGTGMGNFSSKLAFRTTGLGIAGGYPRKYVYIYPYFMLNHLDLYLNFFSKQTGLHSLTNSPFSVYDQLITEYGVLGLLAFLVYYLWFFARHYKRLTYGLPILALMMAVLFVDYWFEQLSIMVLFELMMFINIKETGQQQKGAPAHA